MAAKNRARLLLDFFSTLWKPFATTVAVVALLCALASWLIPGFVGGLIVGGLLVGLGWMWSYLALRSTGLDGHLLGAEGEENVGALLDGLASFGATNLNDLYWRFDRPGAPVEFNIDHVVVASAGVWCLETKSTVSDNLSYLDRSVASAAAQAKRNADRICDALRTQDSFSEGQKLPRRVVSRGFQRS